MFGSRIEHFLVWCGLINLPPLHISYLLSFGLKKRQFILLLQQIIRKLRWNAELTLHIGSGLGNVGQLGLGILGSQ